MVGMQNNIWILLCTSHDLCLICEFLEYTCCFNNLKASKETERITMRQTTMTVLSHLPKIITK